MTDTEPASELLGGLDPTENPDFTAEKYCREGKKEGKEMHVQKISIILLYNISLMLFHIALLLSFIQSHNMRVIDVELKAKITLTHALSCCRVLFPLLAVRWRAEPSTCTM